MNTIYKFPLDITKTQHVTLSNNSKILSIQLQYGRPYLWATIDPTPENAIVKEIIMVGTGWEFNEQELTYINTIQLEGYVWHYFIRN